MPKYLLPFVEVQRGYYEYEADSLEHAKALADEMVMEDFESIATRHYKDGEESWDYENLVEDNS